MWEHLLRQGEGGGEGGQKKASLNNIYCNEAEIPRYCPFPALKILILEQKGNQIFLLFSYSGFNLRMLKVGR